ncbi:peptide chain release factor N(5)-glutamine methyltransferase [Legionella erythra]|uniref:Release factor glutamine methyltransferase n=1 Tax=Legionella erythra TaxID=448 RepID=A0A0W0TVQ2_LEGER|nr:peptide chain release factor N(5)-glutamine methyltransferase [Legionella erythra]KTC99542.1 protein methyltransferase HemK [Legionella erythra]
MTAIKEALAEAMAQLKENNPDCRIDAEVLLAHVLIRSRSFLYSHPENELTPLQWSRFKKLVAQRRQGFPIAYLTGIKEFWSLPIRVTKDTLIPRPETELLIEITLSQLQDVPDARVLDLGTGSGAIALALAKERPAWQIVASDFSEGALKTAVENASNLGLTNIQFIHSDWFTNIHQPASFHAIVANPPYIASTDPHLSEGDVRFEPQTALVSGETGLQALKHIISQSLARLCPNGLLLVEHGYDQKSAVESMLKDYGYKAIHCWQDWQGNDRVSGGKRNNG